MFVHAAAMAVFCTSVALTAGVVSVGAQAARVSISNAMSILVFMISSHCIYPTVCVIESSIQKPLVE